MPSIVAVARPEHVDLAIPASPQNLSAIMRNYSPAWAFAGGGGYFSGSITATSPIRTNAYGYLIRQGTRIQGSTGKQRPVFVVHGGRANIVDGRPPEDSAVAVEAGPWLTRDERPCDIHTEETRGDYTGLQPTVRRPRAGIGIRADGCVVYAALKSGTLADLQSLLQSHGCQYAMALDGGGSVGTARPGDAEPPVGSWSRALPAAIVFRELLPDQPGGGESMKRILIDPGHGGRDPGAVSGSVREADVVLEVARYLGIALADSLNVRLTHDGQGAELKERTDMANKWGADYFLSIHVNAAENRAAHGVETYLHPNASAETKRIAPIIHKHLAPHFRADRGVKTANFHVLRETKMPAILVELGFVTNDEDRENLAEHWFRRQLAQSLADGVKDALGIKQSTPAPTDWQARALAAEAKLAQIRGIVS